MYSSTNTICLMSTKWFSFYWHGHRRGSLLFTVFYNPETKDTAYDSISTSHLEYLESISEEYVPSAFQQLSSNEIYRTLRDTICAIFKHNGAILDSYEKNKDNSFKNLVDFAFSEFEWIGEKAYFDSIIDMKFTGELFDMPFQKK